MEGEQRYRLARVIQGLPNTAFPAWQSPNSSNSTLLPHNLLCESKTLCTPTLSPWDKENLGRREDFLGAGRKQWSGQGSPRGNQARLEPGFSFFLSLILFLLNFLILGILHLFWPQMSHNPMARVTRSRNRRDTLAKRQQEAEAFPKG